MAYIIVDYLTKGKHIRIKGDYPEDRFWPLESLIKICKHHNANELNREIFGLLQDNTFEDSWLEFIMDDYEDIFEGKNKIGDVKNIKHIEFWNENELLFEHFYFD